MTGRGRGRRSGPLGMTVSGNRFEIKLEGRQLEVASTC
jgi:hypothetical protein